jgi:hypothetical protein
MRSKELSEKDCVEAQIGGRYQKDVQPLKVPKNTVASIILKWNKFGTTGTIPRAGHPAKLSNQGRGALVREVQSSSVEMGEPSRRTTISAALHQLVLYGRVARTEATRQ